MANVPNAPDHTTQLGAPTAPSPAQPDVGREPHRESGPRQRAGAHAEEAKRQGRRAAAETSGAAASLQHEAYQTRDEMRRAAEEAGEQMRDSAARTAAQAREQVGAAAERQKDWVSDEIQHVGEAIRSAADHLHTTDDDRVASYADMAAEQLESTAGYLRKRDVGGLVDDMSRLAKRRPELFLGGMFVAGLGISRFLKASQHDDATDPVRSHAL